MPYMHNAMPGYWHSYKDANLAQLVSPQNARGYPRAQLIGKILLELPRASPACICIAMGRAAHQPLRLREAESSSLPSSMKILLIVLFLAEAVKGRVLELTDKDFETHLLNRIPLIVNLYAPWCGHCHEYTPAFEKVAAEYGLLHDSVRFARIDADSNRRARRYFKVDYFPTIVLARERDTELVWDRQPVALKKFIKDRLGIAPDCDTLPSDKEQQELSNNARIAIANATDFFNKPESQRALVLLATLETPGIHDFVQLFDELAHYYRREPDTRVYIVDAAHPGLADYQDGVYLSRASVSDARIFLVFPHLARPVPLSGEISFKNILKQFARYAQ